MCKYHVILGLVIVLFFINPSLQIHTYQQIQRNQANKINQLSQKILPNMRQKINNLMVHSPSIRCSKTPFYSNSQHFTGLLLIRQRLARLLGYYYNVQLNQCIRITLSFDTKITSNFFKTFEKCQKACLSKFLLSYFSVLMMAKT